MTIQITVTAKQMKVVDPGVSEKDRAEIQSTMLGPKVLDPDKYPEIRFQSSHVEKTGDHYRVTGKLELHGASRELSFESVVSDGISRHCPETGSKHQPWYAHWTCCPSNWPYDNGIPRCGQLSRIAKASPEAVRPRRTGRPRRSAVPARAPRTSSLRSAGYQNP